MRYHAGDIVAGRWKLDALLGKGSMGEVWIATQTITHRRVAAKFLRPHADHEVNRTRFLREAWAAGVVNHPNVVSIHDVFELEDGSLMMLMDLLEGETLRDRLTRERSMSLASVAEIMLPVVAAVGAGHQVGVIHRDLKPENIFLLSNGKSADRVRVLDFGLAKIAAGLEAPGDDDAQLTGTNARVGTPFYMSPEQAFGDEIDQRADVWAIGAILYELLSGHRPVDADSIGKIVRHFATQDVPPLKSCADVPDEVCELVGRMLSRDPEQRDPNLASAAEVLRHYTVVPVQLPGRWAGEPRMPEAGDSSDIRRRWLALAGVMGIAAFLAMAFALAGIRYTDHPTQSGARAAESQTPVKDAAPATTAAASVRVPAPGSVEPVRSVPHCPGILWRRGRCLPAETPSQ